MKLLIATTNQGKIDEIKHFFKTAEWELVTLSDLEQEIPEPQETELSLAGNALLKAKYYAVATGLVTLADDSGLFIDALDGWPGVKSARVAETAGTRIERVLTAMKHVPKEQRTAEFSCALAVYNPISGESYIAEGTQGLEVLEEVRESDHGFGYDPILYVPAAKKRYADMTLSEKNDMSHRGIALTKTKYYLHNHLGAKEVVCPVGILIKDGKVLMNRRNDPYNPENHNTWEFPGGGVEFGETIEENVVREVQEECGFDVQIVKKINYIQTEPVSKRQGQIRYQIFILPYICEIIGGDGTFADSEVLEMRWFDPNDLLSVPLIGNNDILINAILPEIQAYIATQ